MKSMILMFVAGLLAGISSNGFSEWCFAVASIIIAYTAGIIE